MVPGMEQFAPDTRRTLALAQEEAARRRHLYITTEHILLGMVLDLSNPAGLVLSELGLRAAVLEQGTIWFSDVPIKLREGEKPILADETRKALQFATEKMQALGQPPLRSEHLLLGMTQIEDCSAMRRLKSLHVQVHRIEAEVKNHLENGSRHSSSVKTSSVPERTIRAINVYDLAYSLLPPQYQKIVFTENVLHALSFGHEIARKHGYSAVNPEHVLLGLAQDISSLGCHVLRRLHLQVRNLEKALPLVAETTDAPQPGSLKLSPRTINVLDRMIDEAQQWQLSIVSTEHLLLGLLFDADVIDLFERLNIGTEVVRRLVAVTIRGWDYVHEQLPPYSGILGPEAPAFAEKRERLPQIFPGEWMWTLSTAAQTAHQLGSAVVDTEHLLMALVSDRHSRAGFALQKFGILYDDIKKQLEAERRAEPISDQIPAVFSPELIALLGLAMTEAYRTATMYIGTEHLLLGMLRQEASKALTILGQYHLSLEVVRQTFSLQEY